MTKTELTGLAQRLMAERGNLPEAQDGGFRIVHQGYSAGQKLTVSSFRDALFTGAPVADLELTEPTTIHKLEGPEGTWMTDLPCELVQMHLEFADRIQRGRVLVGGLGLGILVRMLARRDVSRITVVERAPEVVRLVKDSLPPLVEVLEADIHEYVKTVKTGEFTAACFDTWQATGEMVWCGEVVPLRRRIGSKIRRVLAWRELMMQSQVYSMLFRVAGLPEDAVKNPGTRHYYAFWKGLQKYDWVLEHAEKIPVDAISSVTPEGIWKAHEVTQRNEKSEVLQMFAQRFVMEVGTRWWEETFGEAWDEAEELGRKLLVEMGLDGKEESE